ncbi:MAG: hypothetical protein RIE86_25480 [Imperialibacter sp.]|uniref:hypothetical protein n=1 Tax=Imperialibacter sp. TaxID=2038411 RepID=UPI0032EAEE1D
MENKIYRSRTIVHPSGEKFETPLLVPSFSSKGFSMVSTQDGIISECHEVMMVATGFFDESVLVSAYDLYHKLIPKPSEFKCARINIIDSGGYETSQVYDLSGINKYNHDVKPWDEFKLKEVLSKWPKDMSGIMVSYDHGELRLPIDEQVENAQKLFHENKSLMSDFLIKPETSSQSLIQLPNLAARPELLNGFDIIGVTEKEIGNSQLDRMLNIAVLRREMDKVGNTSPIHVFGSLDPFNVILYFLAGAEVFDGLTWLKFAYHNCVAIYIQNYSVLSQKYGIETKDKALKRNFWVDNITFLTKLKYALINFSAEKNYDYFKELDNDTFKLSELIEKLHGQFLNKLKSK